MFILKDDYFLDGYHEQMNPASFISPDYFTDEYEYLIVFSHRWTKPMEGHTAYLDFITIRNRIENLHSIEKKKIGIFYDYSCIYQDNRIESNHPISYYVSLHGKNCPFSEELEVENKFVEYASLRRELDLKDLYLLFLIADEIYLMQDRNNNYYTRCWCLMEVMIGQLRESIVYRTKPSPFGKNLDMFNHSERILYDIRLGSIMSIKGIQDYQTLLDSANCMFESDRQLVKEYIQLIVEKVFVYKVRPRILANDYHYLLELIKESKREAILLKGGKVQEVLNEIVSRVAQHRASLSLETISSHNVVSDNELDVLLENSEVLDFIKQVHGFLEKNIMTEDEIRTNVRHMIKIGLIKVEKNPDDKR